MKHYGLSKVTVLIHQTHPLIKMKTIIIYFALALLFSVSTLGCLDYRAGNLELLSYPIDTKLSYDVRKEYLDSISQLDEFKVPAKWRQYNKLIDINPNSTWRVYFKDNPEEMYLVTINNNFVLEDVFNPQIVDYDWVAERKRMPEIEQKRVIKRVQEDILNRIEQMAKRDGCPDSILYFKPKYINEKWTTPPKWR
jgi:hypothetical protein